MGDFGRILRRGGRELGHRERTHDLAAERGNETRRDWGEMKGVQGEQIAGQIQLLDSKRLERQVLWLPSAVNQGEERGRDTRVQERKSLTRPAQDRVA